MTYEQQVNFFQPSRENELKGEHCRTIAQSSGRATVAQIGSCPTSVFCRDCWDVVQCQWLLSFNVRCMNNCCFLCRCLVRVLDSREQELCGGPGGRGRPASGTTVAHFEASCAQSEWKGFKLSSRKRLLSANSWMNSSGKMSRWSLGIKIMKEEVSGMGVLRESCASMT